MWVGICLVVALGLWILRRWRASFESDRNPWLPWAEFKVSPPLVTDARLRDVVIAQRWKPSLVKDQNWDTVIIGSGIGGLTVGALLSRAGRRVLVLEQHTQAGGCCHVFRGPGGIEFDVGIHYVGNLEGSEFRVLIDQITEGRLNWVPLDREYDQIKLCGNDEAGKEARFYSTMAGTYQELAEHLLSQFPSEGPAIYGFITALENAKRASVFMSIPKLVPKWLGAILNYTGLIHALTSFFKMSAVTMEEEINRLTNNPDLKAVLQYCQGDFGCAPSEGPWSLLLLMWNHFRRGAAYPYGGASQIPYSIIPVIQRGGGKVLCGAKVSGIRVGSDGAVSGVQVGVGEEMVFIPCQSVVSDAGLLQTFTKLLPLHIATASRYMRYVEALGSGHVGVQLFVGLKGTATELGLTSQSHFIFADGDLETNLQRMLNSSLSEVLSSAVPPPVLYVTFPSAKDPSWETRCPGRSTLVVICATKWDWFKEWKDSKHNQRPAEYEQAKREYMHYLWHQLLLHFPQLEGQDDYMDFGSPLSTRHFIGASKGEIYGLDHGVARWDPKGLFCAADMLGRNLFADIINLRKEREYLNKKL